MSLLAVDIGNSSTTIGLYSAEALTLRFHFPTRTLTHRELTREALHAPLRNVTPPETIGISSVVPWASDELIVVLHELFPDATILVVTSGNIPISIDYPNPDELGTDRLIGALAAYKRFGERANQPCIVVDLGTATTFDCVTDRGVYLGGAIAPGLGLGAQALAQQASQLPAIEIAFPASMLGRTTTESMQSGVLYGGLALIEGMVRRFEAAAFHSSPAIVVATGGYAHLLQGRTTVITHIDPDLILEGIRIATVLLRAQSAEQRRTALQA